MPGCPLDPERIPDGDIDPPDSRRSAQAVEYQLRRERALVIIAVISRDGHIVGLGTRSSIVKDVLLPAFSVVV